MKRIEGNLYDGNSSQSYAVGFYVGAEGEFFLEGYDLESVRFDELVISSRIGNSARYLDLPSGVRIETHDNDAIDELLRDWKPKRAGILHTIEANLKAVVLSGLVLISFLFLIVIYGIPAMSGPIVRMLPAGVDDLLGAEVLEQLDSFVFEPSALDASVKEDIRTLFSDLVPDIGREFDLQFRGSELLGANAFALPNAQIVLTDQLINLSASDEMLASILLHEIGHVVERHTMQAVVRRAGFSMLLFGLTGDVGSAATALVVLLPSFLVESSYSRDLEWDADSYALDQMKMRGLDANAFADMMELILSSTALESDSEAAVEEGDDGFSSYFGSHPPTRSRIDRFRQASEI